MSCLGQVESHHRDEDWSADFEVDIAASARVLGLSKRELLAQQDALRKGFHRQQMHLASREADSKTDITVTDRDLGNTTGG
jgi:hypothetical protein